ncbi:2757_t:CDS:2, partial [Acaulospora colombiana]
FGQDLVQKPINNIDGTQSTVEESEPTGDSRMAVEILTRQSTVLLETRERLPEALLSYGKGQDYRRVQAEQHNDITLDLKRVFFALDIPSDASPGFNISVDGHGTGGLQWRLRICLLVGGGNYSLDSLGADGELSENHRTVRTTDISPEQPSFQYPSSPLFGCRNSHSSSLTEATRDRVRGAVDYVRLAQQLDLCTFQ